MGGERAGRVGGRGRRLVQHLAQVEEVLLRGAALRQPYHHLPAHDELRYRERHHRSVPKATACGIPASHTETSNEKRATVRSPPTEAQVQSTGFLEPDDGAGDVVEAR